MTLQALVWDVDFGQAPNGGNGQDAKIMPRAKPSPLTVVGVVLSEVPSSDGLGDGSATRPRRRQMATRRDLRPHDIHRHGAASWPLGSARTFPPIPYPLYSTLEKTMNKRKLLTLFGASALLAAPALGWAQTYPSKPVRLIVPFAPGGTTDIVARIVAPAMGSALGQQVLVENKAGGGGSIGALEMIKATPDGHVLGVATVSTTAANPAINPKIGYDPAVDFVPIINIAATPNVIAVHPSFPARDYKGFIAELKKFPGKYSYASSGTGGIGHLQTELFKSLAGVFMTHIPYRGAGPALNDTVAGQVQVIFDNMPSALPFIRDGRLIPIVVAAPQRLTQLPNVPTFKEVGLEPVNRMAYYGVLAPKGTSKDVVNKVSAAVRKALEDANVRKRIEDTGALIVGNTPEQFAAQMKAEFEVYKNVVAKQGLKLE